MKPLGWMYGCNEGRSVVCSGWQFVTSEEHPRPPLCLGGHESKVLFSVFCGGACGVRGGIRARHDLGPVADWNVDAIHQENGHMEVSFNAEHTWTRL